MQMHVTPKIIVCVDLYLLSFLVIFALANNTSLTPCAWSSVFDPSISMMFNRFCRVTGSVCDIPCYVLLCMWQTFWPLPICCTFKWYVYAKCYFMLCSFLHSFELFEHSDVDSRSQLHFFALMAVLSPAGQAHGCLCLGPRTFDR